MHKCIHLMESILSTLTKIRTQKCSDQQLKNLKLNIAAEIKMHFSEMKAGLTFQWIDFQS